MIVGFWTIICLFIKKTNNLYNFTQLINVWLHLFGNEYAFYDFIDITV